jgi:hypothetical protein
MPLPEQVEQVIGVYPVAHAKEPCHLIEMVVVTEGFHLREITHRAKYPHRCGGVFDYRACARGAVLTSVWGAGYDVWRYLHAGARVLASAFVWAAVGGCLLSQPR